MAAITRQPLTLDETVEKVGVLTAVVVHARHRLSITDLVEHFTSESAATQATDIYLSGIAAGLAHDDAAGEAGATLVRTWSDARLKARAAACEAKFSADRERGPVPVF